MKNDPQKPRRDLPPRRERPVESEPARPYEPAPSARAFYESVSQERDTVRDLRPPFMFEPQHESPEPSPDPSPSAVKRVSETPRTTRTPSAQLLRPGERFKDKYRIVSVLNTGTLARVYHAKQLPSERDVALKVLLTRYANRPEIRHAMQKEGTELSRMKHPGVVTIHDFGNDEHGVWIVSEFLNGETSRKELKAQRRFTLERTVAITLQVAAAVAAAHERDIIHGDLKPENIFLEDDDVKVVDFLTARILSLGVDDELRDEFAYATAEYAAPECFDKSGDPDARSDIYSLAIIFIEFVTGVNPMLPDGPAADALLELRQRDFSPPVPPEIPTPLAQVLRRALEKKPDKRQQSMRDFAADLERAWKHVLKRANDIEPTWLDRVRPSLPSLGVGSCAGVLFGLLASVLIHALPARTLPRPSPTAALTEPFRELAGSSPRQTAAPSAPPAPVGSVVQQPAVQQPALLSVAPSNKPLVAPPTAAPTPRPKPLPVRPPEHARIRPLEISDAPPF